MPANESAKGLQKRLRKVEQAQVRLGALATRIQAQAEKVTELIKLANSAAAGNAAAPKPGPAPRPRKSTAAKAPTTSRKSTAAPAKAAAGPRRSSAVKRAPARVARKPASGGR